MSNIILKKETKRKRMYDTTFLIKKGILVCLNKIVFINSYHLTIKKIILLIGTIYLYDIWFLEIFGQIIVT